MSLPVGVREHIDASCKSRAGGTGEGEERLGHSGEETHDIATLAPQAMLDIVAKRATRSVTTTVRKPPLQPDSTCLATVGWPA